MMEAAGTSQMLVPTQFCTLCHFPGRQRPLLCSNPLPVTSVQQQHGSKIGQITYFSC